MKRYRIHRGDCRTVLQKRYRDSSFDAIVTDPPYGLTTNKKGGTGPASNNLRRTAGRSRIATGFMGKAWDNLPPVETWKEILRVAKPGAHLLAFGGTRTYHRLVTKQQGRILDPFMGSGTTGVASLQEGFNFVGVEGEREYFATAKKRMRQAARDGTRNVRL